MSAGVAEVTCKSLKSLRVSMCAEVAEVSCKSLTNKGSSCGECVPISKDIGAATAAAAPDLMVKARERGNRRQLAARRLVALKREVAGLRATLEADRSASSAIIGLMGDLVEELSWLDLPEAQELVEAAFDDLIGLAARVGMRITAGPSRAAAPYGLKRARDIASLSGPKLGLTRLTTPTTAVDASAGITPPPSDSEVGPLKRGGDR